MRNGIECACKSGLLIAALGGQVLAQVTQRVSVDSAGAQANGDSYVPVLSADGRFVAFMGDATNLVLGDTNGFQDVFVRDRQLGTTERVNLSSAGVQANGLSGGSFGPALSADARYVAFRSDASNLVAGDTNGSDVFVRDRQLGLTERVSVSSTGAQGDDASGLNGLSISADARYVAFTSDASNLVTGDTGSFQDVFVRDRQLGTTEMVSLSSGGVQGNFDSWDPALSADGRYVSFMGDATNLVSGDTNARPDVFVRDRLLGATERVSVSSGGVEGNSYSYSASLSANGRYVVFESSATNLVAGDTNLRSDVFVRDRQLGATERVSLDSSGAQGNDNSDGGYGAAISADGRYVAFQSAATNLVAGDTNAVTDVYVRDRQLGLTERVSIDSGGGQVNGNSAIPALSADGRCVAFHSGATNLVSGDTNGFHDVFVRDRGPLFPGAYCTAGTTTNGCAALIAGTGTPSASAGSGFTLSASSIEGQKQGLFFYGLDNSGYSPNPWGGGTSWLCVKAPTQRTPVQSSGGTANLCDGAFALDWNAYIATNAGALGNPFGVGQHVFAQAWFRDPPAPKTTNLSNAFEFVVDP